MDRTFSRVGDYPVAISRWVWMLQECRRRTLQALEGLEDEVVNWTPPEGGNSIGTILYHIVAIEMSYIYEDVLGIGWHNELEPFLPYDVRQPNGQLVPICHETFEIHEERLIGTRTLVLRRLHEMKSSDLARTRYIEDYTISPEWAFFHLLQHEAEHRGQIMELRTRAAIDTHDTEA